MSFYISSFSTVWVEPLLPGLMGGFTEIPAPLKMHLSISYLFFMICCLSATRSLLVVIERPNDMMGLLSFGLSSFFGVKSC